MKYIWATLLTLVSAMCEVLGLSLENTGHDWTHNVTLADKLKITKHERVVIRSTDQCDCVGQDIAVPSVLVSEEQWRVFLIVCRYRVSLWTTQD